MTADLWAQLGVLALVLGGAWWFVRRVDRGEPKRDWRERMAEKQRLKAWRHIHPSNRGWRIWWWLEWTL